MHTQAIAFSPYLPSLDTRSSPFSTDLVTGTPYHVLKLPKAAADPVALAVRAACVARRCRRRTTAPKRPRSLTVHRYSTPSLLSNPTHAQAEAEKRAADAERAAFGTYASAGGKVTYLEKTGGV